jgi:cation diffusion facilitator CzcD-associated flavoprotein CzcO
VVTDHIDTFTETGIRLRSGQELEADLVVTATGLKLKFLGGMELEVDGKRVELARTMTYKGMMCSDVPNLALATGYTNASWTLKCDLTSEFVCRLINHMEAHGYTQCCPRKNDPSMKELPLFDFTSGYVQRSIAELPRQGSAAPWKLYQNYAIDLMLLRYAPLRDRAMEFS